MKRYKVVILIVFLLILTAELILLPRVVSMTRRPRGTVVMKDETAVTLDESFEETQYTPEDDAGNTYEISVYEEPKVKLVTTNLRVRQGPSTDYAEIGMVRGGDTVLATGEADGWIRINFKGDDAYMSGDYLTDMVEAAKIIFVGDSRTVQMKAAVGGKEYDWIAEAGQGYYWFVNTALPLLNSEVSAGTKVLLNLGVNDVSNADKYIERVNSRMNEWSNRGATVYYASVNPVSNYRDLSNEQIDAFNEKLKNGLDARVIWIDSNSYLKDKGFQTADGLHYRNATYIDLYGYYLSQMNDETPED